MAVSKKGLLLMALTVIGAAFLLNGCATLGVGSQEGIAANIAYDLPSSAKITKVAYFYENYKGKPTLHFEVGIQNITDQPKRFRLNILLPEGPAVGGMYPRKKPAIEAGDTLERKFPVYLDAGQFPGGFMPSGYTLMVKEL
jgi:hypothetical protein